MTLLQSLPDKIKGNGAVPLSTPDSPATIASPPIARPLKRKSFFAGEIWTVESKPGFAFSSLYGRGK